MGNRLTRSRSNRVIGGVCGGLGAHLSIDPILIRIFFVLLALGDGIGVLLYLVLWLVIPLEGAAETSMEANLRAGTSELAEQAQKMGEEVRQAVGRDASRTGALLGLGLVALGVWFLVRTFDIPWFRWLDWEQVWPMLLILAGVVLLWRRVRPV
jgi:phage shock protein PspC (stress-responsive transcriptional regulator)